MAEIWVACYGVPAVSPSLFSKVKEHHTISNVFGVLRTMQRAGASRVGLIHT